ncbi:uncharacterized protein LOC144711131 [Wolffia australiana]
MMPRGSFGLHMQSQQYPLGFQQLQYSQKPDNHQLQDPSANPLSQSLQMGDFSHGSEEEEPSEEHSNAHQSKPTTQWHRMKWTDNMVKLLITIVSYIGEDASSEGGRKLSLLQKKGKWKSVSSVMAERGFFVSPQQCEDKFNDLNKRYKRLTDILGRGTSCRVVENPALLEMMDHLSDKAKDDVRKILNSKHLFYEEMCSYHNCNRLHLPADPSVQRSLQLALRNEREEEDGVDGGEDDGGGENSFFAKRVKLDIESEDQYAMTGIGSTYVVASDQVGRHRPSQLDLSQMFPEGSEAAQAQEQMIRARALQLQEHQLHIQSQMAELERHRARWRQMSQMKDRELDQIRLENDKMRLENEQLALQLKYKELKSNPSSS